MEAKDLERSINIGVVSKALMSRDILREAIAEIDLHDLSDVANRINVLIEERKTAEKQKGIEAIRQQMKALGVDISDLKENKESRTKTARQSTTIEIIYNNEKYIVKSVGRPDPRTKELFESLGFEGKKKEFIDKCQQGLISDVELIGGK